MINTAGLATLVYVRVLSCSSKEHFESQAVPLIRFAKTSTKQRQWLLHRDRVLNAQCADLTKFTINLFLIIICGVRSGLYVMRRGCCSKRQVLILLSQH